MPDQSWFPRLKFEQVETKQQALMLVLLQQGKAIVMALRGAKFNTTVIFKKVVLPLSLGFNTKVVLIGFREFLSVSSVDSSLGDSSILASSSSDG